MGEWLLKAVPPVAENLWPGFMNSALRSVYGGNKLVYNIYRPPTKLRKVMFSQVLACPREGGDRVFLSGGKGIPGTRSFPGSRVYLWEVGRVYLGDMGYTGVGVEYAQR